MKKYKRKRFGRFIKFFAIQLMLLLVIVICFKKFINLMQTEKEDGISIAPSTTAPSNESEAAGQSASVINLEADRLVSRYAILVRLSDQKVLLDKDSKVSIHPASLTKIMTAIVAIENLKNLKQTIKLPSEMFQKLYDEDASMAGFLPGESVPAIDLLYGVLLPSGAECCIGLADYIAGSEDNFVKLMNDKAKELDLLDTHFINSTGLSDPDHYTTAADLAKLLEYCLKNSTFRDIFTSRKHSTSPTTEHPGGITFYSTMFKNLSSTEFNGGSILGGKTGYTNEAGLCLASLATVRDTDYILVTADAKGNHDTKQYNISDAMYVYQNLK